MREKEISTFINIIFVLGVFFYTEHNLLFYIFLYYFIISHFSVKPPVVFLFLTEEGKDWEENIHGIKERNIRH